MRYWIDVVDDMSEPFDYEEFKFRMKSMHPEEVPQSLDTYGQQVGLLMLAYQRYPRLQPHLAYQKLMEELQMDRVREKAARGVHKKGGCNGCR